MAYHPIRSSSAFSMCMLWFVNIKPPIIYSHWTSFFVHSRKSPQKFWSITQTTRHILLPTDLIFCSAWCSLKQRFPFNGLKNTYKSGHRSLSNEPTCWSHQRLAHFHRSNFKLKTEKRIRNHNQVLRWETWNFCMDIYDQKSIHATQPVEQKHTSPL